MKKQIAIAATVLILSSCATQQPRIKETVSGYPEATAPNATTDDVRNELMRACASRGIPVLDSSDNSVTCGKQMSGGDAILAQWAIGNSYSTSPWQKVQFTFYRVDKDVNITARQWVETQMAFGQMRQAEMNANNQFNDIQVLLNSVANRVRGRAKSG